MRRSFAGTAPDLTPQFLPVLRVLPANLLDNANALADKGLGYNASRQQSKQQRSICVST